MLTAETVEQKPLPQVSTPVQPRVEPHDLLPWEPLENEKQEEPEEETPLVESPKRLTVRNEPATMSTLASRNVAPVTQPEEETPNDDMTQQETEDLTNLVDSVADRIGSPGATRVHTPMDELESKNEPIDVEAEEVPSEFTTVANQVIEAMNTNQAVVLEHPAEAPTPRKVGRPKATPVPASSLDSVISDLLTMVEAERKKVADLEKQLAQKDSQIESLQQQSSSLGATTLKRLADLGINPVK